MSSSDRANTQSLGARVESELEREVDALIHSAQAPTVVFQPIAHLPQLRVVGYEALSRFSAQPRVSPDQWFAAAARIGREADLSALVLEKALSTRASLPRRTFLTVNISPEVLLSDAIQKLLEVGPLDRMIFELTEHAIVTDYDQVAAAIARVRELGGFVAVDDAGAGYASMHHILTLHPDFVKLDGSLVADLHRDPAKSALVEMFGEFTSRIDAWLIAEGIESSDDLHRLRQIGVPLGQGYLLGRPAEAMTGIDPLLKTRTLDLCESRETVAPFIEAGQTASADSDDSVLRTIFDANPEVAAIALLDASGRPIHLAARCGERDVARHNTMRVNRAADRREVLRRAMTRPRHTRFDPLVCCDENGQYIGMVPIDALISSLAAR